MLCWRSRRHHPVRAIQPVETPYFFWVFSAACVGSVVFPGFRESTWILFYLGPRQRVLSFVWRKFTHSRYSCCPSGCAVPGFQLVRSLRISSNENSYWVRQLGQTREGGLGCNDTGSNGKPTPQLHVPGKMKRVESWCASLVSKSGDYQLARSNRETLGWNIISWNTNRRVGREESK